MAISFDTSGSLQVYSTGPATTSVIVASTANRYMLVNADSGITAVSYAGVDFTLLQTLTPSASGGATAAPVIKIWGLANPASGTNTLSITGTSSSVNYGVIYAVYNGVDSVQPEASNVQWNLASPGNQYFTTLSTSITTPTSTAWVVTAYSTNNQLGGYISTATNATLRTGTGNGLYGPEGKSILDSNTTVSGDYSSVGTINTGSGTNAAINLSIKPYLAVTLTGPSSGNVNAASTNFTLTPDVAINGSVTITPSGTGSSGLSPTVLNFSNSSTPQTFTITPLTSGAITLTVTNAVGLNNSSPLTYTAVAVAPSVPTIGTATPLNASASITFAGNSDGGSAITQYRAISTPGSFTGTGLTSPLTVTGLSNGTPYTFTVRATNAAGNSAESSASNSATPFVPASSFTFTGPSSGDVRSASTNFTVTPNSTYNGTITITPSGAGSDGLSPVVLTFNLSSAAQTFTITPLTSGSITLTPSNSNGISNPSDLVYTANAVVPLAPSIGLATPSLSSATVAFSSPSNNGGATITSYTVTSSPGGLTATSTSPGSVTVRGLTNGTSYTFSVTATNSVGTSASSSASNAVIPTESSTSFTNSGPKFNITKGVGNLIQF